jgi:hypothetical protein
LRHTGEFGRSLQLHATPRGDLPVAR